MIAKVLDKGVAVTWERRHGYQTDNFKKKTVELVSSRIRKERREKGREEGREGGRIREWRQNDSNLDRNEVAKKRCWFRGRTEGV